MLGVRDKSLLITEFPSEVRSINSSITDVWKGQSRVLSSCPLCTQADTRCEHKARWHQGPRDPKELLPLILAGRARLPFRILSWKLMASTEAVTMLVLQWRAATIPATSSMSFIVTPAQKKGTWLVSPGGRGDVHTLGTSPPTHTSRGSNQQGAGVWHTLTLILKLTSSATSENGLR